MLLKRPTGCRIDGEEVAVKTLSNLERSPVRLPRGWSHACQQKKKRMLLKRIGGTQGSYYEQDLLTKVDIQSINQDKNIECAYLKHVNIIKPTFKARKRNENSNPNSKRSSTS